MLSDQLTSKKMPRYMSALVISVLLTGCGGGSGSDTPADNVSSGNAPIGLSPSGAVPNSPAPNPVVSSTADIVVPETFAFSENNQIMLTVQTRKDAHVSVCKPASLSSASALTIDYNDCLMKSWVRTDSYQTTFSAPDHVDSLLAAVLIPSESRAPTLYEWRKGEGSVWSIQL